MASDAQARRDSPVMDVVLTGIGAWGPGFTSWPELAALLLDADSVPGEFQAPRPAIIPANERRRSPLPVRLAVETSWQCIEAAGIPAAEAACVFGSGNGDTDITDYICKVLLTEEKLMSPTRFHNSVHNAAAGYWTISTGCMRAANSIAAWFHTPGLALFEAALMATRHQEHVLVTLYDTVSVGLHASLHPNSHDFGLSLMLSPFTSEARPGNIRLQMAPGPDAGGRQTPAMKVNRHFDSMVSNNPAARILLLMEGVADLQGGNRKSASASLSLSEKGSVGIVMEKV